MRHGSTIVAAAMALALAGGARGESAIKPVAAASPQGLQVLSAPVRPAGLGELQKAAPKPAAPPKLAPVAVAPVAAPLAPAPPAAIAEAAPAPENLVPERKLAHDPQDEGEVFLARMIEAGFKGPDRVALNGQASMMVPAGRIFVRADALRKLLPKGEGEGLLDDSLVGLLFDDSLDPQFMIFVEWEKTGFIKDGDAQGWDADKLLESYKKGTEAGNAARVANGGQAVDVIGWVEKPAYDLKMHRLVHAISARHRGETAPEDLFMNYSTYALGREGMFNIVLAAELSDLDKYRSTAQKTLAGVTFIKGKAYEDADTSRDAIAPFTVAALAGGAVAANKFGGAALAGKVGLGVAAAAKKLGLLKVIGLFFVKFWKQLAGGVALLGVGARKLLRRK